MSHARVATSPVDAVEALRKKIRGEALTPAEETALAAHTRKVDGPSVPHVVVVRELEERQRRGR